jgi:hypothetical protein
LGFSYYYCKFSTISIANSETRDIIKNLEFVQISEFQWHHAHNLNSQLCEHYPFHFFALSILILTLPVLYKKSLDARKRVIISNGKRSRAGLGSQNFLLKFVKVFVTLGLKILRLFRVKVLFEANII